MDHFINFCEDSDDSDDDCEIIEFLFFDESDDEQDLTVNISAIMEDNRSEFNAIPKVDNYIEVINRLSAEDFKSHFRLYPTSCEVILLLISPMLEQRNNDFGNKPIPAKNQLLMSLWFMATPESFRSVSDRFGVGKATCFRSLRRVVSALFQIAHQFIQWPTEQRAVEVMNEFHKISGLRGVIGAIDGTLIEINKPSENGDDYICRKGYSAIHLQAVCTQKLLFTSVLVGHAGSVHDARVLRNSQINDYMEEPEIYFPNDSYLVGDAAYPLNLNLMVPFKNNGYLTGEQINFNRCLSTARVAIERSFGVLKTRWRRIFDRLSLIDLKKIPEYVVASCVLHNICILHNDFMNDEVEHIDNQPYFVWRENIQDANIEAAKAKRTAIMNDLQMRF